MNAECAGKTARPLRTRARGVITVRRYTNPRLALHGPSDCYRTVPSSYLYPYPKPISYIKHDDRDTTKLRKR